MTKEDLQQIRELLQEQEERTNMRMSELKQDLTELMDAKLQEQKQDLIQCMNVIIESEVTPKFNLLADGQNQIREMLIPRARVDDLEDEVKFLKLMCQQMAEDIAKLKKAQ